MEDGLLNNNNKGTLYQMGSLAQWPFESPVTTCNCLFVIHQVTLPMISNFALKFFIKLLWSLLLKVIKIDCRVKMKTVCVLEI